MEVAGWWVVVICGVATSCLKALSSCTAYKERRTNEDRERERERQTETETETETDRQMRQRQTDRDRQTEKFLSSYRLLIQILLTFT